MIPQGELLVDDAPHDCLNSQVHHILPTPTHQGLVGCMEVGKWVKYIVKKGISTQEILLFLIDPRSSSCYMPLSSNLTSSECQKLYPILSFLLTTQPAKTRDPILWCCHHLNYWRQNEVPSRSVCKVCHLYFCNTLLLDHNQMTQ
jgi:hypothetical protein